MTKMATKSNSDRINPMDETWLRKELNELRGAAFFLSLVVFATIGCLIGYFLLSDSFLTGPFENIAYAESGANFEVTVETKIPTRARVEYGTSTDYLNRVGMGEDYQTSHAL